MIAQDCELQTYAGLWERTRSALAPLGLTEEPVPPEWASAVGILGQVRLVTASWIVGAAGEPAAVCRVARLHGAADGHLTLISPTRAGRLPVFTAELLAVQGRPQLTCLDVRTHGLDAGVCDEVAEQTAVLAVRHALFLPPHEPVPEWAVHGSPGGFLFSRSCRPDLLPRFAQAYDEYFNTWLDFAYAPPAAPPAPAADAEAAAFRRTAAERESVLEPFFGRDWAQRFLSEFWYR
jgi:hypothetical protein